MLCWMFMFVIAGEECRQGCEEMIVSLEKTLSSACLFLIFEFELNKEYRVQIERMPDTVETAQDFSSLVLLPVAQN